MAKRAQLVSQHLENISHEALSKYQDVIRSYVRGRQGIYALYRKNELYYVGLAGKSSEPIEKSFARSSQKIVGPI